MRSETRVFPEDRLNLFVYGTLMRGGERHRVLAGQCFLGEARTRPLYALFDLVAYPGLVHRADDGRAVQGELYEVATDLIERLDQIEGAPSLYRLESVLIENHLGDVFAYFYQQPITGFLLCPENRWRNGSVTGVLGHDPGGSVHPDHPCGSQR